MGDFTSAIPSFAAFEKARASELQTLADFATATTAVWTTWSPTLTNLTLGNGTVTAKYRRLGKTVDFRFKFKLGSTSAVGTTPQFTLPFAPSADYNTATDHDRIGRGTFFDNSSADARVIDPLLTASSTIQLNHFNATPTSASTTATVPWTWATSDVIDISGTYYTD